MLGDLIAVGRFGYKTSPRNQICKVMSHRGSPLNPPDNHPKKHILMQSRPAAHPVPGGGVEARVCCVQIGNVLQGQHILEPSAPHDDGAVVTLNVPIKPPALDGSARKQQAQQPLLRKTTRPGPCYLLELGP